MVDGEYAVLFAGVQPKHLHTSVPSCVVFDSLADAEEYSRTQTALAPKLRCSIYDHRGLVGAPVSVIAGAEGADRSFISSGFRRWVGGCLFVVGSILAAIDWSVDFRLMWPGTLGFRMAPIGAVLLLTEIGILLSSRHKQRRQAGR